MCARLLVFQQHSFPAEPAFTFNEAAQVRGPKKDVDKTAKGARLHP